MRIEPNNTPLPIRPSTDTLPQQENAPVDTHAQLADIARQLINQEPQPEVRVELNGVGGCTVHCGEKELAIELVSELNAQALQHLHEIAEKCQTSIPAYAPTQGWRGFIVKKLQKPNPANQPTRSLRGSITKRLQKPNPAYVEAQSLQSLIGTTKKQQIMSSSQIMPEICSYLPVGARLALSHTSKATCESAVLGKPDLEFKRNILWAKTPAEFENLAKALLTSDFNTDERLTLFEQIITAIPAQLRPDEINVPFLKRLLSAAENLDNAVECPTACRFQAIVASQREKPHDNDPLKEAKEKMAEVRVRTILTRPMPKFPNKTQH